MLTTDLTGNIVQTSTGIYQVDLDLKNATSDRINVSGTSSLSGNVDVNLIDPTQAPSSARPGTHDLILVSASEGNDSSGLTLQATQTAVATYSLIKPNATDTTLQYDINYSPEGLTRNQHSIGNAVNQIQLAQESPAFGPIATALFYQKDVPDLGRVYDSLSGEGTSAFQQTSLFANDHFFNSIEERIGYWISDDIHDPSGMAFYEDKDLVFAQQTVSDTVSDSSSISHRVTHNWREWITRIGGNASYNDDGDDSSKVNQRGYGISMG